MQNEHTNDLINESSPYLLQHAHNPVDWKPWNDETLKLAEEQNKPLLISIGYSACHWCHVMEHESFENEEVAKIMNDHFICIKVDREERPDVDQIYMDAVQLMTGQGGWPLNCFALPDGRPFFGGTYFPKDRWIETLKRVHQAIKDDKEKIEEYANKLLSGLNQMDEIPIRATPAQFTDEAVDSAVSRWSKRFDNEYGGAEGAPKFPLPNNYSFLLHYALESNDNDVSKHVLLTLKKMAFGGIYDQIGGGFSRYSTDKIWKAPHFEKMLYDNAQLLSLYAEAYKQTQTPLYKSVIEETVGFIETELLDESGALYSALDADSEGEEGRYYVWTKEEVKAMAGDDFEVIQNYYQINSIGRWEGNKYILMRSSDDDLFAKKFDLEKEELLDIVEKFKATAKKERANRIKPGLDDKSLTSWNAMTIKGLLDAYSALGNEHYLNLAERNMQFLLNQQLKPDGSLWHSYKNGSSTINGYLEDYAHMTQALLSLYQVTFKEQYLVQSKALCDFVLDNFDQTQAGLFYFKNKRDKALIAQKSEVNDNVIPSSNSVFSTALYRIGLLFGEVEYLNLVKKQLAALEPQFNQYPAGYSQWMSILLNVSEPFYEVAIVGEDCEQLHTAFLQRYLPNTVLCGGKDEGSIPILAGRKKANKTLIYVCENGACQLPVETVDEAIDQMR
ncbi:MAG: thioredoxin domain-containing protein [Salibacteraceae bacterium]